MDRNRNVEPKPYVLVDIPQQSPRRAGIVTHDRFDSRRLTGQMELSFIVVSRYLFVGSGDYEIDLNIPLDRPVDRPDAWHTFYRRNGQICVPGSTIKGAIRAILEAISNSCVSQYERNRGIKLKEHQPCQFKDKESSLCPGCRLFGTTGYRGRVHFSDFLPQGELKVEIVKIGILWEPRRPDSGKRRFYEGKTFQPAKDSRPERGYQFLEAVKENTVFSGTLSFENVSKEELGLIFYAMGWKTNAQEVEIAFAPKIGGAKPRCFGSVRFDYRSTRLRLWGGDMNSLLVPMQIANEKMLSFLQSCLKECQKSNLLDFNSWKVLMEGLQVKDKACPKGVY